MKYAIGAALAAALAVGSAQADVEEKEFLVVGTWGNLFNWKEHESRMWQKVLPEASGGKLTANEFVAVTSTNAAKIFNIYPRKGSITIGADADLIVWDPAKSRTISASTHHQNIDFNIYEGMEVTGLAAKTISHGKLVWDGSELRAERGAGQHIDRPCFPSYSEAIEAAQAANAPTPVER